MTPDDLTSLTGGDESGDRQLRRALRVLAEHHGGTPLASAILDVLSGRTSARELAARPDFTSLAHRGMEEYARERAALGPEQRAAADREAAQVAGWAQADAAGTP